MDSWSPLTIDTTMSQARTKAIAGEFSLQRVKGAVVIDSEWKQTYLATIAIPRLGNLTCNKQMTGAALLSFRQISEAGLADKIDFVDTKRLGGCFNARENRTAAGTSGRNLSRHSWAIAIDVNPTTNPYGNVPTLDRCVVEIFRSNGLRGVERSWSPMACTSNTPDHRRGPRRLPVSRIRRAELRFDRAC